LSAEAIEMGWHSLWELNLNGVGINKYPINKNPSACGGKGI